MSNTTKYFHFTIGPVQSFVSQARRTRDFWAGSFLLSWLSAVAMKAVQVQTGDDDCILFPQADQHFLDALSGKKISNAPTQGSVPNRFKAKVNANFEPQQVIDSVQYAWQSLATIIFKADIERYANPKTETIWQQQIEHTWDMSWVLCDDDKNSAALDQRKNWRSHVFPAQAGVKCMMMADWQELSGINSPNRTDLHDFWSPLQQSQTTMSGDLREEEHLCAIAFVKRRFVHYFHHLQHLPMPDNWTLSGWKLSPAMPSVSYMAAVHWLETALKTADPAVFRDFYHAAYRLTGDLGEWKTRLHCLQGLNTPYQWTSLDGNVFHPMVLENINTYPKPQKAKQAQKVIEKLKKLNEHVKQALQHDTDKDFTPASPFYAVLMMDGDSLGKQMSDSSKQEAITHSLKEFTDKAKTIVEAHNGFLIYAGGDDVLAILPLEDALTCAAVLRQHYLHCFDQYKDNKGRRLVSSTLSGAIEYAHIKIPLTKVLYDAHHLLDDIAKEKTGRDSIAVRIQKPGGLAVEWSQPWEVALDQNPNNTKSTKSPLIIEQLADTFRQATAQDATFSSKFFYKIRERFDVLNPVTDKKGKILHQAVLNKNPEAIDLMCMEYLNSGKTTVKTMQQAKTIIEPLLTQCRRVTRDVTQEKQQYWQRSPFLRVDAALLVRFLAHKGIER